MTARASEVERLARRLQSRFWMGTDGIRTRRESWLGVAEFVLRHYVPKPPRPKRPKRAGKAAKKARSR